MSHRRERAALQARLLQNLHPRGAAAEAYRITRTNLRYLSVDEPLRRVGVVSALPGEGKSLTVSNLALALSQDGVRPILIDADLRRPELHHLFNLSNRAGLSTVLSGQNSLDEAVQTLSFSFGDLAILPGGPMPPNPGELLGSKRRRQLDDELLARGYDIVLYDSSPILVAADAAVLAANLDGVLMVVRAGSTDRRAVQRAKETVERVRGRVLGIVLNRVKPGDEAGGYAYYYHYGAYASRDERGGSIA